MGVADVRRPPNVTLRMTVLVCFSVFVLYVLGKILLLFNPPTDLDRACLSKTLNELNKCADDYQRHGRD
jgi:hypothetical protein